MSAGLVATAWHVLEDVGAGEVGATVAVDPLGGGERRGGVVVAIDALADLALLRPAVALGGSVAGLAATDEVEINAAVLVTGVSRLDDPGHEHRYLDAPGTWAGGTTRDDQLALGRVRCPDVLLGMSGAPVRRLDDDVVVGVLSGRYNSVDGWLRDSVWVARCERLEALCADFAPVELRSVGVAGAIELALTVDDERVRLSGGDVDVACEHGGVSPGLGNAIDEVRRARARAGLSRELAPAVLDAPATVAMDRAGRLLADSFLPATIADSLTSRLRRAESAHQPLRLGVVCEGELGRLPWEVLPDPRGGGALALRPLVNVHRRVRAPAPPAAVPGPLRILIAISSPERDGGAVLDYERELRNVLAAVRSARQGDAHVRVVAFATTAQIRAALEAEPVHVLHLSGHGAPGSFVFEREDGAARELDADTFLAEAIPPGAMPAVIALAACYTNVAKASDAPSFAARLLERGAAVVIASETSVTDLYATRVFARVYGRLADAAIPDAVAAVCDARRVVQRELDGATHERDRLIGGLREWAVLSVLAGAGSVAVFDPKVTESPPPPPARFAIGKVTARAVGEFVGRRREQRHWPTELLAHGRGGLVLHGIGGIGKTTLAAELVSRVRERDPGRAVVVLEGELSIDGLLDELRAALRRRLLVRDQLTGAAAATLEFAGRSDVAWADRLALLREHPLATVPLLVVLDNFEDNLDRDTAGASVREPTIAAVLAALVRDPGAWRLLITSRYEFVLPDAAQQHLAFKALGALSAAETRKLVWSLPTLDSKLDDAQLEQVWRMVGGHPRSLEYLDALLSHGAGRYADITTRLTDTLTKRLPADKVTALLEAEWRLDDAIAQVATLAADDVLLDELVSTLASTAGAEALLIGAAVYREPVDTNALRYQIGEPDERAASVPDQRGARERINALLRAAGVPTDAPPDLSELPEAVLADLTPHLAELQSLPTPPRRTPARLTHLIQACVTSTLLSAGHDDDAELRVFVHRWTASELERRLTQTGRRHDIVAAHKLAAEYWQWRVAVWPQDRHADVHDLLEARHHLLAADQPEQAGAVTEAVCAQLHEWGAWDQEAALIHDTLARLPATSDRTAAWTGQLGIVAQARGDLREAETQFRRSLEIDERLGNQAGIANSYHQLGNVAYLRGDLREAETQYRRSLEIKERLGDQAGIAGSYHQLGMLAQDRGDMREAETQYRRSLEIFERLGNQAGIAGSYHQLGMLAQDRGDLREAETQYRRSLEINERLGDQAGIATSYHQLGNVAYLRGDLREADTQCRRSLEINERLGNQAGIAGSYHQLGMLAQDRGDLREADTQYRRSLEIKQRLGDQAGIATSYHQLGMLAQDRGDLREAETQYRRSLEIKERLGDQAGIATSYHQLGMLAQDRGDLREAETQYRRSLEIKERLGNQPGIAASISQLGILTAARGDVAGAIGLHGQALVIRARIGVPQAAIDVRWLREHRARVGDDALLRALGEAVGPQAAAAVLGLLDEAARTEDAS